MSSKVTPIGTFAFPSLNQPRENLNGQLEWNIGLVLDEVSANQVITVIEEVLAEERKKNMRFPSTNAAINLPCGPNAKKNEAGEKVPVAGEFLFKFKRGYEIKNRRTGESRANSAPVIYDSQGAIVMDPPLIGNGSEGRIIYRPFAYDNAQKGVGLYLIGVQLFKLKSGDEIKLDPIEGGWTPGDDAEDDGISAMLRAA